MARDHLSLNEARRIALAAQGFDRPRPRGRIDVRHLRRVIHQLGLLQIDYVNVLIPAHYQVPFSRLGPYEPTRLDDLVYRRREFTEQWAHEASIVPMASWPLLRYRREAFGVRPHCFAPFVAQHPDYMARVLDEVRRRGALSADDLPVPTTGPSRLPGAWYGTVPRAVLETHFGRGILAVADRRSNFARRYDLASRVIPSKLFHQRIAPDDARRALLCQAARSHGVGTAADLADYHRMPMREARPQLEDLVQAGALRTVRVEGWREPAYLHPEARLPRRMAAAALLSPFDPVVWFRPRAARLFDFTYRIEIFVPRSKRQWGYYVLPFLLGDRLVARVDLKADRAGRRLQVLAAYRESHAAAGPTAVALAKELRILADWLALDDISVTPDGDFGPTLAHAVVG